MSAEEQVRALEAMDLQALRAEWRRRCGVPPSLRSPELLRRLLAHRIQTEAYGGLDASLRRRVLGGPDRREHGLAPGARIAREWKGVRHEVEVVEGGFLYESRLWSSLSEVARSITGVRWNGPRFFGLRHEPSR